MTITYYMNGNPFDKTEYEVDPTIEDYIAFLKPENPYAKLGIHDESAHGWDVGCEDALRSVLESDLVTDALDKDEYFIKFMEDRYAEKVEDL